MERRKRQFRLLVAAVALPAALLSVLTFLLFRQDEELARQRSVDESRTAAEQARRALAERLDAIQLREINRRIQMPESPQAAPPADSAIVFVVGWGPDGMLLPWQSVRPVNYPSSQFTSHRDTGEIREFQGKDPAGAADQYRLALRSARQPGETCEAQLNLGRALIKSGNRETALQLYREMLSGCGETADDTGMLFTLYAAGRLIELNLDIPGAMDFLTSEIQATRMRPLSQLSMIQSLLQSAGTDTARRLMTEATAQIADVEQALALASEFERIRPSAEKEWIAYGAEPWLLKLRPASFPLPPLLFVVSSRKVAPLGTKLVSENTLESEAFDTGFAGVRLVWDPPRSFSGDRSPALLYAVGIAFILVLTLLGGYLLLHGVNRDLQMAEMRSQFVASVSHELKTPLTAIRMFAETLVLGRTRDEHARSEYLETIVNESERLARLVDNVLDFSKIEQGKKIYRMQKAALPEVVRSAARAMQYPLSQQGFNLDVSVDEQLPLLAADTDALEQAILNLLSNAMKYSGDARRIDLCCSRRNGDAVIAVTDRGIGIDTSEQALIFEKFYRVRASGTELIAGTGLGLTLVKHIAQAHGGSVDVHSAVGKGSTFSIRIPFSSPEVSS